MSKADVIRSCCLVLNSHTGVCSLGTRRGLNGNRVEWFISVYNSAGHLLVLYLGQSCICVLVSVYLHMCTRVCTACVNMWVMKGEVCAEENMTFKLKDLHRWGQICDQITDVLYVLYHCALFWIKWTLCTLNSSHLNHIFLLYEQCFCPGLISSLIGHSFLFSSFSHSPPNRLISGGPFLKPVINRWCLEAMYGSIINQQYLWSFRWF